MRQLVHEVSGLKTTEEVETSARSQLYLLLSDSFQIPDNEFYTDVKSGQFRSWISDAIGQLPYELAASEAVEMLNEFPLPSLTSREFS